MYKKIKLTAGFTLIEVLVIISIIAVLAVVGLAIIKPADKAALGRDSLKKQAVSDLGRGVEIYYITNFAYPTPGATWMSQLVTSGVIKSIAANPGGNARACSPNSHNQYCFTVSGNEAYVWTHIESEAEAKKCASGVGGSGSTVVYAYGTNTKQSCIKCGVNGYTLACNAKQ